MGLRLPGPKSSNTKKRSNQSRRPSRTYQTEVDRAPLQLARLDWLTIRRCALELLAARPLLFADCFQQRARKTAHRLVKAEELTSAPRGCEPRTGRIAANERQLGSPAGARLLSSQALAKVQSRWTVGIETPSTSAVSRSSSPPKNLSSTTRLARASTSASCVSA